MFIKNTAIFSLVMLVYHAVALTELPRVDDNNILKTEAAIRNTINTLFYTLKLKGVRTKPRLREYSTVHNHLISFTLQDYNNLKEIAKLTRVDRHKINNETWGFMVVINELLNEDIDVRYKELPDIDDESVFDYVDQFLTKLKSFKEQYGVNDKMYRINDDVYKVLKDDEVASYNYTMDSLSELGDTDMLLNESEYWHPDWDTRRIYRGDRTKVKHFPFMASIQIFNKFHCGGCIIKSDLVITASSCLQLAWNNRFFRENPAFLSARVGSNFYNGGGENIAVMEVYFHPDYDPKTLWHNLCIVRLVRKLNFRKKHRKIKKIEFDTRASGLPVTTDGITVVGWGARGASNIVRNPWENSLAFAVLDIYPLKECQEVYSKQYVTRKHFCAGFFSKGGGACNRDVGGPGIVNGILTGIISFGSPVCGTTDAPTVFTKLGFYTDWIEGIMDMDVPHKHRLTTIKTTLNYFTIAHRHETTTFKIPPVAGKLKPIPISEVDALRLLADENLFTEFLTTMFHDKDAGDYADLFPDKLPRSDHKVEVKEVTPTVSEVPDNVPVDYQETTQAYVRIATEMGQFDPNIDKDYHVDDVLSTKPPDFDGVVNMFEGIEGNVDMKNIFQMNEEHRKVTQMAEEFIAKKQFDNQINEYLKPENTSPLKYNVPVDNVPVNNAPVDIALGNNAPVNNAPVDHAPEDNAPNAVTLSVISKSDELEKDLVNLIDNIDLKEIIDNMPSIEEEKLALDEKVIKLFQEKADQDKVGKTDDSVLTLLYLSSAEKKATNNIINKNNERFNEITSVPNYDEDDDDDADASGISIEAGSFKDLTYRNSDNLTSMFDKLTREELNALLAKHLEHLQPKAWR